MIPFLSPLQPLPAESFELFSATYVRAWSRASGAGCRVAENDGHVWKMMINCSSYLWGICYMISIYVYIYICVYIWLYIYYVYIYILCISILLMVLTLTTSHHIHSYPIVSVMSRFYPWCHLDFFISIVSMLFPTSSPFISLFLQISEYQ